MKRVFGLVFTVFLVPAVVVAAPVNLVINGDFSAGNTGFISDYAPVGANTEGMYPPGVYTVDTSAVDDHDLWVTGGDHTTGTGNFMLVNGFTSTPNLLVWSQTLAVTAMTDYFFEAFTNNLCCNAAAGGGPAPPTANLSFLINGLLVGSGGAMGAPGFWTGISTMWNSGSATTAVLQIRDSAIDFGGNDFGIDDVYLGTQSTVNPVPEPFSMLLLGSGLAMVAKGVRGKRKVM